tara:strand:- start:554 stop:1210 length:657 start_codon:yes stop_codon:yes gene_type:complete
MRARLSLERMFRAFNRRPSEDAIGNFMEFCSEFGGESINNASNYVVETEQALPTPAEFKKICKNFKGSTYEGCSDCKGKGYTVSSRLFPFDDDGFKIIGHDLGIKCHCEAEIKEKVKMVDRLKHKHWTMARILAKSVAKRSGLDLKTWAEDYWTAEDAPIWVEHAERLDTMVNLIQAEAVIDETPVKEVLESPYSVAMKAVDEVLKYGRAKSIFGSII